MLLPPNECTDWYLFVENGHSICYPNGIESNDFSSEYHEYANTLLSLCITEREKLKRADFKLEHLNEKYRVYYMETEDGGVFKLRRIVRNVPQLSNIKIPEQIKKLFTSTGFFDAGLLLVCGEHGNGKSTTCASLIVERLTKVGGVCITAEDPVEFDLSGKIGLGYSFQTEVKPGWSFSDAIRGAARAYPVGVPGILFIGEIRDAESAAEAIKASVNGRLVIASIHGNSLMDGLYRILSLSSSAMNNREEACKMLANGFRAIIHQKLILNKRLKVRALLATDAVYGSLYNDDLSQLSSEIDMQNTNFSLGQDVTVRRLQ